MTIFQTKFECPFAQLFTKSASSLRGCFQCRQIGQQVRMLIVKPDSYHLIIFVCFEITMTVFILGFLAADSHVVKAENRAFVAQIGRQVMYHFICHLIQVERRSYNLLYDRRSWTGRLPSLPPLADGLGRLAAIAKNSRTSCSSRKRTGRIT